MSATELQEIWKWIQETLFKSSYISKNDLWLTLLTRLIWITLAYTWLPGNLQKRFLAYLAYTAYILLPAPFKPSHYWFHALSHLVR